MQIEPAAAINWQALSFYAYVAIALLSAFWGLGKLLMWQFQRALKVQFDAIGETLKGQNAEFEDIKRRLEKQEDSDKALERELMALRAELPRDYVRREDFTRVIASFEVKVDNLRLTIERLYFKSGSP
jgi:hypothetical protein